MQTQTKKFNSEPANAVTNWKLRSTHLYRNVPAGSKKIPKRFCGNCGYTMGGEVVETDGFNFGLTCAQTIQSLAPRYFK